VYTRIVIYSGPDSDNRCHHSRHWMADFHPGDPAGEFRTVERGQYFFAVIPDVPPIVLIEDKRSSR